MDILAWIITGAWGLSFILDASIKTYDPPATVHFLMMTVAGAAFGSTLIQRNSDNK